MKTLQIISFFLLLTLFACCDKEDEYTPEPLPYFYCKVNGQNFSRRPNLPCRSLIFNYYPNGFLDYLPGTVIMVGRDCISRTSVGINLVGYDFTDDTIHLLETLHIDSSRANFLDTESEIAFGLSFEQIMSGYVKFDSFADRGEDENGIVSGTFEFTVRNEELDSTVVITDGRFQYIIDYEWY